MKTLISALVGLSVLASVAAMPTAANAQCTVKGWTNGLPSGPIWDCPNS